MPRVFNNSIPQQIIKYVQDHPGCARADIIAGIGFEGDPLMISNILGRLKRENALASEGPYPKLNRWYPIETTDDEKFHEIAADLLEELNEVHHEVRQNYLAKRLEEIFGDV